MLLALLIFVAALLYASIGHGGASGYLAAMALMGLEPSLMKPTALILNILVASIATFKFYKARAFRWPLFWPLVITSIPLAYLGGKLHISGGLYKQVVGLILLYAAIQIIYRVRHPIGVMEGQSQNIPHYALMLGLGGIIGFLSGLTGVGGGIFLTPIILLKGWTNAKTAAGISAAFILLNSVSGLAGHGISTINLPHDLWVLALAAALGGWIGAEFGSHKFKTTTLQKILALVLAIAGIKMLFLK